MKKLNNSLYVLQDGYVHLSNNNVVLNIKDGDPIQIPLNSIENICVFGHSTISSALIGKCYETGIALSFFTNNGKFQGRVEGKPTGSINTRIKQSEIASDQEESFRLAKNMIYAKIYNCRKNLQRFCRDYKLRIDVTKLSESSDRMNAYLEAVEASADFDQLRGIEGTAAKEYFSCWSEVILNQKEDFSFSGRNRRPPLDRVNCLLSLAYTMLTNDMAAGCDGTGLDSYFGINHTPRPGRKSLALDLVEELRPVIADRFVLSLINRRLISAKHFEIKENGACLLNEAGKKVFFSQWQQNKQTNLTHPFLKQKVTWGLVPYIQATLFADYIRGELDDYPSFFWK